MRHAGGAPRRPAERRTAAASQPSTFPALWLLLLPGEQTFVWDSEMQSDSWEMLLPKLLRSTVFPGLSVMVLLGVDKG